MQFVLLIYQGTTPTPASEAWATVSAEEKKAIYAEYAEFKRCPASRRACHSGCPTTRPLSA